MVSATKNKNSIEIPKRRHDGNNKRSFKKGGNTERDPKGKFLVEEPRIDIRSILRDIQFIGHEHITWKEKKDLENRKVVSLGGKLPKKQRLPLSVARVAMKKQKEREEKQLEEHALLGRFGGYYTSSSSKKPEQRRRPEDRILRTTVGNFKNGILDVKHMLNTSSSRAPTIDSKAGSFNEGPKKRGGKKKSGGKRRR